MAFGKANMFDRPPRAKYIAIIMPPGREIYNDG